MQRRKIDNSSAASAGAPGAGGSVGHRHHHHGGSVGGNTRSPSSQTPFARYCLPGVPGALKFVMLSFLGFVALVVYTAERNHRLHSIGFTRGKIGAHGNGGGAAAGMFHGVPRPPAPLLETLKRQREERQRKEGDGDNRTSRRGDADDERLRAPASGVREATTGGGDRDRSAEATERMLAQSSSFVDAEKNLKRQLSQLAERQKKEKDLRGVKIANRYLGEDLLPYPESKAGEGEWFKKMKERKEELTRRDKAEWSGVMKDHGELLEELDGTSRAGAPIPPAPLSATGGSSGRRASASASDPGKYDGGSGGAGAGTKTWPAPSERAGPGATVLLKPTFGVHRPDSDAVLVFAEGYDLSIYLAFVESLESTGYGGDVVMAISQTEKLQSGVKDYLLSKVGGGGGGGINLVAYEVEWSCFARGTGEPRHGSNEGSNDCKTLGAFGDAATGTALEDPRVPRPVATARYELYWMWCTHYRKDAWIMLIDARDAWFQSDPFESLPHRVEGDREMEAGELHFFGENADAVRIGTSKYNKGWLLTAYGQKEASRFFDKPVVCSGSTMGRQVAIETYLRAMVAEFDSTLCKSKGCDQGFHNYLHYSGKLVGAKGVSDVIVHEQGRGIINNLGALRTKPLSEWGLYDPANERVLNWDGSVSPVAHQYDRDKEANKMVKGKKREFQQRWANRQAKVSSAK